jgi:uncharacterized protein (DUF1499 family)
MLKQKRSRWLDRIGSILALILLAGILVGWLRLAPAMTGFYLFALGGIGSALMAVIFLVRRLRGHSLGAPGLAACAAGLAFLLALGTSSGDGPPINDFTTDLETPPSFTHARTLPANLGREMGYPADYASQQEECCSDLEPQEFSASPAETLDAARNIAEGETQWTVSLVNPENGTIEAVASTTVFGFQDDIVIRVRPNGSGSIVDIRSKSRDGKSDLGANAARIRSFQNKLSDQIH